MKRDAHAEGMRWLEQAEADREGAQLLFDGESYHLACFVAQQVAEKALKAFLYAQGEDGVVGHSVEALSDWAGDFDSDFADLREEIAPLDGYYIPTRYPNGLPDRTYVVASQTSVEYAEGGIEPTFGGRLTRSLVSIHSANGAGHSTSGPTA